MPWASAPSSGGETQLHRAAPSGVCAPRCSPPGCSPAPSFHLPSPPLLRPPDHTLLPCLDGGSRVPEGWGGGLTLTSGWTLAPDKLGPGCVLYRRQENGTCPCPRVMMLQTSKETTPWARLHPWYRDWALPVWRLPPHGVPSLPCVGNIDLLPLASVLHYHFALDSAKCVARSNLMWK